MLVYEIIGWYGAVAIIAAYFLASFGVLGIETFWSQALNLTGAIGIMVISYVKKVYQSVTLNLVWATIAIVAIIRLFLIGKA